SQRDSSTGVGGVACRSVLQDCDVAEAHYTTLIGVCDLALPSVSLRTRSPAWTQQCAANGLWVTPNTMFTECCRLAKKRVSASESSRQRGSRGTYRRARRKILVCRSRWSFCVVPTAECAIASCAFRYWTIASSTALNGWAPSIRLHIHTSAHTSGTWSTADGLVCVGSSAALRLGLVYLRSCAVASTGTDARIFR